MSFFKILFLILYFNYFKFVHSLSAMFLEKKVLNIVFLAFSRIFFKNKVNKCTDIYTQNSL